MVAAQIVQGLVRVLAAAAQGVLELNKKEGGNTMDFLFGAEHDTQMSAACACAGGCVGCMGSCSGCSGCQGAK